MQNTREVPATVRIAFVSWLVAVGAGILETVLVVTGDEPVAGMAAGIAFRTIVFGVAFAVAWQMYRGRRWARPALAVGLGVIGLSSLITDPIAWLAAGNSIAGLLAVTGPADIVFGISRTVHTLAVLTATALMFTPASNVYFRRGEFAALSPIPPSTPGR